MAAAAILQGVMALALLADSENFGGMSDIAEAVLFCNFLRPFFNGATFDFHRLATALADQVMMMGFTAEAIDRFAIISA